MIILDNLNWNDLKYLVVVSQNNTLPEAAKVLKVNQSTVFRRINQLEETVGVKLFIRSNDGYKLSPVGEEILGYAEEIVGRIADIQLTLNNQSSELSGQVNLTVPHNFGYHMLPKYIYEFQTQYPDIIINLHISNDDCDLSKREADLAIRACSEPPYDLVGKHLFSLPWCAYASDSYLEVYGKPSKTEDLNHHKIISSHVNLSSLPAFKWIRDNIPPSYITARSNDLISMSALAEEGVGIAILPTDQAKAKLNQLFAINAIQPSELWLLFHPDMRNCKRLKVFKNYLIEKLHNEPLLTQYQVHH